MKIPVVSALIAVCIFSSISGWSQKKLPVSVKPMYLQTDDHTVCYAAQGDANVFIPPPHFKRVGTGSGARIQAVDTTGKIKVTYTGFSPEAKKAFQYAVNIWRTLIVTEDTIHIQATWRALGSGILGSASPGAYYANFDGAQRYGVYYPIALAEKIAHHELNEKSSPDIVASFSSSFTSWYYGTDGKTPALQYDLVSVVLHEIGHGLGIFGFYSVSGTSADFSIGFPGVYDTYMENNAGANILASSTVPSTTVATTFKSSALFFNSPLVLLNNSAQRAQLYAPATFQAGSSIYHLDEAKYGQGNKNSLMTPQFNTAEAIHNPGPIVMSMLKDMGWNDIDIDFDLLPNTEAVSADFVVSTQLHADTLYDASSVKLVYATGNSALTTVPMTTSGSDNFTASLPKPVGGATTKYSYYFSATDNAQRPFVFPGKAYVAGAATQPQLFYTFTAGPDTHAPIITHTPTGFIKNTETQLTLEALITDDIGVQSAVVQYKINNVAQSDAAMVLKSTVDSSVKDSTFTVTLNFPQLSNGDSITYRIVATDVSTAHNVSMKPVTGYYKVNVVSIGETKVAYENDFNGDSNDFYGDNLFGISTAAGFTDGAINTTHPYPIANPRDSDNYSYILRFPIRINARNPVITFDEIALVEPNDAGTVFGQSGFYDYVVTEGSLDGGVTWKPFVTGYNCRANANWLAKWNSSNDGSQYANSTGVGNPTLYAARTINMLTNGYFAGGNEVLIRFRLKSDQLTSGWGWAIDNLKIQIDEIPPIVLHDQVDFVSVTLPDISIATKVTDASGVASIAVEYKINNGAVASYAFPVEADIDTYSLDLNLADAGVAAGDELEYRIVATDSAGNVGTFPAADFLKVAILDFSGSIDTYTSDFNSSNGDFAGNFFSVTTSVGFSDGAVHSPHPYSLGFGLNNTSSIQYMLKKQVKVSADNPYISFREIAVVESTDYVVVEASKDQGATWVKLLDGYTARAQSAWQSALVTSTKPTSALYKPRAIDITGTGTFKAGDLVLIRFRLYSDAANAAWGWAIDDLSIQGTITGLENPAATAFSLFPNPVDSQYLSIEVSPAVQGGSLSLLNIQGQPIGEPIGLTPGGIQKVDVSRLPEGFYLAKIQSNLGLITRKIIVKR